MAKKEDALIELLSMASPQILEKLILHFAASHPDVRRECFDYLKARVSVSKALENKSEGEIVLAELFPDISIGDAPKRR